MKLLHILSIFVLAGFLSACASEPIKQETYNDWRHSLKDPERSDMIYGGNTVITKEKKVDIIDTTKPTSLKEARDYMTSLAYQLRRDLLFTGAQVKQKDSKIYIQIPAQTVFGTNQASITGDFESTLNDMAENFKEYPETMIQIIGHTDNSSGVVPARRLSLQQAQNVLAYLHGQGIESERLLAEGKGPDDPIANNATAQGRAQNCYIEMIIHNLK